MAESVPGIECRRVDAGKQRDGGRREEGSDLFSSRLLYSYVRQEVFSIAAEEAHPYLSIYGRKAGISSLPGIHTRGERRDGRGETGRTDLYVTDGTCSFLFPRSISIGMDARAGKGRHAHPG